MTIMFEKLPNSKMQKGIKDFSVVNVGDEVVVDFTHFSVDMYGAFALNQLGMVMRADKLKCKTVAEQTGKRLVVKFVADII